MEFQVQPCTFAAKFRDNSTIRYSGAGTTNLDIEIKIIKKWPVS